MKVRFLSEAKIDGILFAQKDEEKDLSEDSANRWIRRNKAELVVDLELEKILEDIDEGKEVSPEELEAALETDNADLELEKILEDIDEGKEVALETDTVDLGTDETQDSTDAVEHNDLSGLDGEEVANEPAQVDNSKNSKGSKKSKK